MLSTITIESGDRYESSKIFLIARHFAVSEYPTMSSGVTTLMNGKSESFAIFAARQVFPLFKGPVNKA